MSHGKIAKTKYIIYCERNLKCTLKMLSSNEHIELGIKARRDGSLNFHLTRAR